MTKDRFRYLNLKMKIEVKNQSMCKNVKNNFTNHIDKKAKAEYNKIGVELGGVKMKLQELFDQRDVVANKLKDCIREFGYTKVSFSEKTGISRPTIDKLLSANIDNRNTFEKHMQKILAALNFTADDLMFFSTQPKRVDVLYSQNAPIGHEMSKKANDQYNLLLDIVDLCAIYY